MTTFSINGRFFSQKTTGVQRYAAEITHEIDAAAAADPSLAAEVIVAGDAAVPAFAALGTARTGGRADPVWEQTRLVRRARGLLLCFGNTGPVAYRDKAVCIHDANLRLEARSYSRSFRAYMNALTPLVVGTSKAIVTVSSYSADMLRATGICRRSDIVVAPNGHEHALRWDPRRSTVAAQYGLRRPFVLLVGSLAPHKNWALVAGIAAALDAEGIDVVACGGGGKEFASMAQSGFSRFKMLGRISDDDLGWLYGNALCLLFPSLVEGFGIPIVEAMALGCPVVASNASCLPSIVGAAGLLLDPADAPAWLAAVKQLAATPALRGDYAGRGLEHVQQFSWRKSAGLYLDLVRAAS